MRSVSVEARTTSLFERIKGQSQVPSRFEEILVKVTEQQADASRNRSGNRFKAGLQAMREAAKEEGRKEGYEEGLVSGRELGRAMGRKEYLEAQSALLEEIGEKLEKFVERCDIGMGRWYEQAEEKMVPLVIEIARRAIGQELALSRESIVSIVQEAIREVRHGESLTVRINPFDEGVLTAHKEAILASLSGINRIEIVADESIESGCEVVTYGGVVDARVNTYLDRLAEEAA